MSIKSFILLPVIGEKNKNRLKKIRTWVQSVISKSDVEHSFHTKDLQDISDEIPKDRLAFWHDVDALTNSMQSLMFDASAYHTISKHFGINAFHPFYDRRVMEFILSLPSKYKFSEGWTKRLLRTSMEGILPNKILQRNDKTEFTPVIKQQINEIDLDALFNDSYLAKLGLMEQKEIDRLKEDYEQEKMERVAHFWKVINIEYWYQHNFINHPNVS